MIDPKKLIEIIEKIKYLSEDIDANGDLGKETVNQIHRICEDALIDWKCENARIKELKNETRAL